MVDVSTLLVNVIAAFAGGAFGAALGALPAFIFTGFMVIAGETAAYVDGEFDAITGLIAFGPMFGPHVSFAGGAAAAAYAAKKGYMDTGFDYHEAKNILYAHGTKPDVLAVGGAFGILGYLVFFVFAELAMPWDPIAMTVAVSAVAHRVVFGYPLIGPAKEGLLNMKPFEAEERRVMTDHATDGGTETTEPLGRFVVEPWLPHQYRWSGVVMIGLVVGLVGAYIGLATGSAFLAFGISAASLLFLNCGVEKIPVTHHISLPASTAALAVFASGAEPALGLVPLLVGAAFGVFGALAGEVIQRVFYAHSDTHFDPPAASIAVSTFVIAILAILGVLPQAVWVPTLGL
ncbi:hypothetical protein [Halalkalicoccus salilacus]|uniref:hypothetical protein n=1 Tax=Halalkalicoccus salilacus TaxID=3117459 RepID=UPI00300F43E2